MCARIESSLPDIYSQSVYETTSVQKMWQGLLAFLFFFTSCFVRSLVPRIHIFLLAVWAFVASSDDTKLCYLHSDNVKMTFVSTCRL